MHIFEEKGNILRKEMGT